MLEPSYNIHDVKLHASIWLTYITKIKLSKDKEKKSDDDILESHLIKDQTWFLQRRIVHSFWCFNVCIKKREQSLTALTTLSYCPTYFSLEIVQLEVIIRLSDLVISFWNWQFDSASLCHSLPVAPLYICEVLSYHNMYIYWYIYIYISIYIYIYIYIYRLYSYHCAIAPVCSDEMTHNLELAQIT